MMSRPPPSVIRRFLTGEAAGGTLLIAAAVLAMIVANSALAPLYFAALHAHIGPLSVLHWINDGLMALFFLVVGLEIKREFVDGHLARWSHRALPVVAAAGGMAVPALIYLLITRGDPALHRGWAIPAATDIAFAIAVLALLGSRAPASLKLLLTTIAIIDDLGAIAIIAIAYTSKLDLFGLAGAAAVFATMIALNRSGTMRLAPYLLLGGLLWLMVLLSGVHATVAGVATAMTIPLRRSPAAPDAADSPLHHLESALDRWVALGVVPLFGFANAGIALGGLTPSALLAPLPLGVAAGLFVGKQIGIFASLRLAVALRLGARPAGATWLQLYGVALLCGIGFTMSLFIGGLAFADPVALDAVKLGVLTGSILSAAAGYALLRMAPAAAAPST